MPIYRVSYIILNSEQYPTTQNDIEKMAAFFSSGLGDIGRDNLYPLVDSEWLVSCSNTKDELRDKIEYNDRHIKLKIFVSEVFEGHVACDMNDKECMEYANWIQSRENRWRSCIVKS